MGWKERRRKRERGDKVERSRKRGWKRKECKGRRWKREEERLGGGGVREKH